MKRYILAAAALLLSCVCASPLGLLLYGPGGGNPLVQYLTTPVMTAVPLPTSGTSTEDGAVACSTASTTGCYAAGLTFRQVPLPFPGTVKNLRFHLGTAISSGTVTVTDYLNQSAGTVTCATASSGVDCNSGSLSDHVTNAYTSFQWSFVPSAAWAQVSSAVSDVSWTYTSSAGQHAALFANPTGAAASDTSSPTFYSFSAVVTSATTNAGADQMLCQTCGFTIVGIGALPNHADTGANHTYTVYVNDSTTAIACSGSSISGGSASSGCCANTTGAGSIGQSGSTIACTTIGSLHVAGGSVIALGVNCPSGSCTANIDPGVSLDIVPDNQNVVPMWGSNISQGAGYQGVFEDLGISTTQNNYQMAPIGMTLSNLQICAGGSAITSGQARTATIQVGASPGTAPTTPGTPMQAQITSSSGACSGAMSGTYVQSAVDATHTQSLTAGETVDNAYTITSAPTAVAIKYSMAATVP